MTQATTAPEDAGPGLAERVSAGFVYYLPSLLVILALLVVWQVAVMALGVKEYILPSPLASLKALGQPQQHQNQAACCGWSAATCIY